MPLKLMYITNDTDVAGIAEDVGVDRIWIDLETKGKEERQRGINSVKSNHVPEDISRMKKCLKKAELMVRVNPLFKESQEEIDDVIRRGAELVMLPMFRDEKDAAEFIHIVDGRAKTMLLAETKEAVENLEKIVNVPGIDEIHIGLNDLHLSYGMKFMFEPLANGQIDTISKIIKRAGIPFGFGGIARINEGTLPARHIVAEHYRLGSEMVILSRSFCDTWTDKNLERVWSTFESGVRELREYEASLADKEESFFEENHILVKEKVEEIAGSIAH